MLPVLLCSFILAAAFAESIPAAGHVVVIASNITVRFESLEASFAPAIRGSGVNGMLMQGNPPHACSGLESLQEGSVSPIMLTPRGNCSFDTKVRNAQDAGFAAVLVYASEYGSRLITMAGNPEGIFVNAAFVTREAGETLMHYLEDKDSQIWLLPTYESLTWSVEAISFVSLLAIGAAIGTWLITKSHRIRRLCSRLSKQQEPCVMSSRIVKAMPSIRYRVVSADRKAGEDACGICLEDYKANQNLRILPCGHKFHSTCVDTWLTAWQASCPICKCDVWFDLSDLQASEWTPLLRTTATGGRVPCCGKETIKAASSSELQLQSISLDIPNCSQGRSDLAGCDGSLIAFRVCHHGSVSYATADGH